MSSRLRVGIVLGQLDLGGSEGQAVALAASLAARGHDVRLFSFLGGARRPQLDALSLSCTVPRLPWLGGGTLGVSAWLRRFRPQVVYTFTFRAHLWGRLAARTLGTPVIVTGYRQQRYYWFDRFTLGWSHAVVCNSRVVADMVQARYRFPEGRLHVIPNGLAASCFEVPDGAAARTSLGLDADAPVIVQVARLHRNKDHETALRSLDLVRRARPEVVLLLVGDGPRRAELERRIAELQLGRQVRLLGARPEVAPILAAAQVAWLTSRMEGAPNALLESMAAGLPVVATCTGGVPELVRPGVEGFLVAPGDHQAIAERTLELLASPAKRRAFGAAGRLRAQQFGMAAMVERTEALLLRLTAEQPPAWSAPARAS